MQEHLINPVIRLVWRLEDRHPELLALGLLASGALLGHLLVVVLI